MIEPLCGEKFGPILQTIGFLQADIKTATATFLEWQQFIQKDRGVSVLAREISGNLEAAVSALFPLTSAERRREIFLPTRSDWIAYVDNGHRGTDAFPPMSHMAKILCCKGARVTWAPKEEYRQYPATIFELYGPGRDVFLNYIRSISVSFDGRKWEFYATGDVQQFEDTSKYSNRIIKDRFTVEDMDRVLNGLGIDAFNEDFYLPNGTQAVLFEKIGPVSPALKEFSLADIMHG